MLQSQVENWKILSAEFKNRGIKVSTTINSGVNSAFLNQHCDLSWCMLATNKLFKNVATVSVNLGELFSYY